MEHLISGIVLGSGFVAPLLALWATVCLYTVRDGCRCTVTQIVFFATMIVIAGLTVRTVVVDDCSWLSHSASLGGMIVFGVMRKPAEDEYFEPQGSMLS